MPSFEKQRRAWRDWGAVNPLYAILTDPRYRDGGDVEEFLETGRGTVASVLAMTDEVGLARQRGDALDFGCGVGRLTWALAEHFDEVVGVDVADSMVDRARALHGEVANCRFVVNARDDLEVFDDESFDLVLCLLVLQHMDSTRTMVRFLQELVRVLRPEGALVVQLPSKVPAHRPPLPPLRSRRGVEQRAARVLRAVGVPASVLYRRLEWVPEMTMLALPDAETRRVLEHAGGTIVHTSPVDVDAGGTESRTYVVTREAPA